MEQNILNYSISLSYLVRLFNLNLINEEEFVSIKKCLARKYSISL